MLDRPRSGERALLLHLGVGRACYEDETEEFKALAVSAGAEVVAEVSAKLNRPNPRYFAGPGKVEEVAAAADQILADLAKRRRDGLRFHWYRSVLKSPSWYTRLADELRVRDPRIRIVGAPEFFSELRRSLREPGG